MPPGALGDLSLLGLSRAKTDDPEGRLWQELQAELAALSSKSTHHIIPDSGHCVHWDQPQAVIDAITHWLTRLSPPSD